MEREEVLDEIIQGFDDKERKAEIGEDDIVKEVKDMVLVKIMQIRMNDKAIVFTFHDEQTGEEIGSRGVNAGKDFDDALFDEIVNAMTIAQFYDLKVNGIVMPKEPVMAIETVMKIAYEQYLQAKQLEEISKNSIIE